MGATVVVVFTGGAWTVGVETATGNTTGEGGDSEEVDAGDGGGDGGGSLTGMEIGNDCCREIGGVPSKPDWMSVVSLGDGSMIDSGLSWILIPLAESLFSCIFA